MISFLFLWFLVLVCVCVCVCARACASCSLNISHLDKGVVSNVKYILSNKKLLYFNVITGVCLFDY